MERNDEMMSLTDALRDGTSPETIRKSFEAALQEAQNEVAAEQAAKTAKHCDGNCRECDCGEIDLDEAREGMVLAVIDYLTALGILPEDMEITDEDIDQLLEAIEEIEEQYKAKLSFMKMIAAMAKMDAQRSEKEKVGNKEVADKPSAPSADDIIAKFLKGLR